MLFYNTYFKHILGIFTLTKSLKKTMKDLCFTCSFSFDFICITFCYLVSNDQIVVTTFIVWMLSLVSYYHLFASCYQVFSLLLSIFFFIISLARSCTRFAFIRISCLIECHYFVTISEYFEHLHWVSQFYISRLTLNH